MMENRISEGRGFRLNWPWFFIWIFGFVLTSDFGLISGYFLSPRSSGCTWLNSSVAVDSRSSSNSLTLDCSLRTLNSEFWNYTFTREQKLSTSRLRIKCSDKLFFESVLLPNQSFFLLENLEDLSIQSCKIRRLMTTTTSSRKLGSLSWNLPKLKTLVIRTYNGDWASGSSALEIQSGDLEGLSRLESLDLSFNNIWLLPPSRFLCSFHALSSFNLSSNHLSEVPEELSESAGQTAGEPQACLQTLTTIDLSFNSMRRIGANPFSRLRKLGQLFLQSNLVEELDDSSLAGLENLRVLNLSQNRLVAIPPLLFTSTWNLVHLHLQNNSIAALSQNVFKGLGALELLDLSRNSLTSLWVKDRLFQPLKALTSIKLSFNQLSYLGPEILQGLTSLTNLHLDNNRLENISPQAFSSLTNLQFLDLSRNRLSVIDSHLLSSSCFLLRQLYLDHNRIRRMEDDALLNCTNLQDLGLAGNILPEVPNAVGSAGLSLLRTLDLGENRILEVSSTSFSGLGQLYGLRLVDNRVSALPPGLCEPLAKLRVLNLAQNRIKGVSPSAFKGCPELRALRLDTNSMEEIPSHFPSQLPSLLWLNVSVNRIRRAEFQTFPLPLEWLDLSYNSLEALSEGTSESDNRNLILRNSGNPNPGSLAFKKGPFLRVLDVSHNRLASLDASSVPTSLETFRLNHNQLRSLAPDTFTRAARLRRVELVGNQLETLPLSTLRILPVALDKPVPQVLIGGNPFSCDCEMEWVTNQLHSRQYLRVMDLESVQCYAGRSPGLNSTGAGLPISSAQFLCPYKSHCIPSCSCCDFDACDCEMVCPENCSCFRDSSWSVNTVECSNLNLPQIPGRIPMDVTRLALDGNHFPTLPPHLFIGKRNLKELALNGSLIRSLSNKTFNGLKSLERLHLQQNLLTALQGYEFGDLGNLRELYLDNNRLSYIAPDSFEKLKFLRVLTLHSNFLQEFNFWQLTGNTALATVSLAANPWECRCEFVTSLRNWVRESSTAGLVVTDFNRAACQLREIGDEFQGEENLQESANEEDVISIPMAEVCNEDGGFPPLLEETNHISPVGGKGALASEDAVHKESEFNSNLNSAADELNSSSSSSFWIIFLCCALALAIMSVSGLAFFLLVFRRERHVGNGKRWPIAALDFFKKCSAVSSASAGSEAGGHLRPHDNYAPSSDSDKLFDAYFIYSRRDEEMLSAKLAPELEDDVISQGHVHPRRGYRLCLHYRDLFLSPSTANPWNPEILRSACESSKRVVLLLSRSFLQGEWTNEDFRRGFAAGLAARSTPTKLILILLPPLSPTSLLNSAYAYPELRLALTSASVLNWTDDNFWGKFKLLLPPRPAPAYNHQVNSISRSCHYCGTLGSRGYAPNTNTRPPYTNLNFGRKSAEEPEQDNWAYPTGLRIPPPAQQGFVGLIPPLPPVQFLTTTTGDGNHPNYHQHQNSLSTISNTYRPLTEQNFSDSTNTIGGSSCNEELDHIYSTLDSPLQLSPGSLSSPKILHSGGSSSSGIGSGNGNLTSPSDGGCGTTAANNGQMYFV